MDNNFYGFSTTPWISSYNKVDSTPSTKDPNQALLFFLNHDSDPLSFIKQFNVSKLQSNIFEAKLKKKQENLDTKNTGWLAYILGTDSLIWIVSLPNTSQDNSSMKSITKSNFTLCRDLGGSFIKEVSSVSSIKSILIDFSNCDTSCACGFLTGMEIASYSFKDRFSSYLKQSTLKEKPSLYFKNIDDSTVRVASYLSTGINLGRHLENLPANIINPESFKNICLDLFKKTQVEVTVFDKDKLKKQGLNLILAVASGSKNSPYMIHLKYRSKESTEYVSLVGKGITFDSGGLDIKTATGMLLMKKDMSGAASLLATCYLVSQLTPKINCDFYLMLAENSVSDTSYRPGDVILTKNNVSVEIHNTDAEGRLLLADGIAQAISDTIDQSKLILIDIATLTGANRMALGPSIMGMYTQDEALASSFKEASYKVGDPLWHMPVYKDYRKNLDSNCADIKNACQENGGGAISASLFLKHFSQGVKHVHFDMYAYTDKPSGAILETGSNGQGVALLTEFLTNLI